MSDNVFSVGYDGERFLLTTTAPDGSTSTARLAEGGHTDADHDAAITGLRQGYSTVRQWAQDAANTNTNWPTMTQNQKDTAMRETIRRLGVLLDHVGDLMVTLNADA
jgi:hypothetical protein